VNIGYGQQSVVQAAAEQMARLPYATGYFDFGSEPAIRLAARLAELAPGDLNQFARSIIRPETVRRTAAHRRPSLLCAKELAGGDSRPARNVF
jgi:hypothetical protein